MFSLSNWYSILKSQRPPLTSNDGFFSNLYALWCTIYHTSLKTSGIRNKGKRGNYGIFVLYFVSSNSWRCDIFVGAHLPKKLVLRKPFPLQIPQVGKWRTSLPQNWHPQMEDKTARCKCDHQQDCTRIYAQKTPWLHRQRENPNVGKGILRGGVQSLFGCGIWHRLRAHLEKVWIYHHHCKRHLACTVHLDTTLQPSTTTKNVGTNELNLQTNS